jgi:hypothetical protein
MNSLRIVLPEPPSLNIMIDLAKKRTRRTRNGGWMKRTLPVVYDQEKETYELLCLAVSREQKVQPPPAPWERWRLERASFRLRMLRDPLELLAGLKWTVDWLVRQGFVADDGPNHLLHIPLPEQRIERSDRGVTIEISEVA